MTRSRSHLTHAVGFTLIEVMVATMIIAIVAVALATALASGIAAQRRADDAMQRSRPTALLAQTLSDDIESAAKPSGILAGSFVSTQATAAADLGPTLTFTTDVGLREVNYVGLTADSLDPALADTSAVSAQRPVRSNLVQVEYELAEPSSDSGADAGSYQLIRSIKHNLLSQTDDGSSDSSSPSTGANSTAGKSGSSSSFGSLGGSNSFGSSSRSSGSGSSSFGSSFSLGGQSSGFGSNSNTNSRSSSGSSSSSNNSNAANGMTPLDEPELWQSQVLLNGVQTLAMRFYDGTTWQDVWDSGAQNNQLPQVVEFDITLTSGRHLTLMMRPMLASNATNSNSSSSDLGTNGSLSGNSSGGGP